MPQVPPPKRHPYDQWSPDARALDIVGDKWTLLIVRDLAAGPRRFVELQRVLPGISTEQLRSRLNRMVADGMLTRKRYREVPPRVDYELTPRARDLMPVLAELALWGYRWAWSQPRPGERVDVGAILRLVPGLVRGDGQRGEVECTITDGHREGGPLTLTIMMDEGSSRVIEEPSERAAARISGDSHAWVAAFSPGGSTSSLMISGDRGMAERMIGQLSRSEMQPIESIDRAVA
ncbi:MAG TPA: helix-turn-helix domain-containing protein [Solirubrobacteraceae bacterium]|jgi:DNA-binding HxlR family transcriptional regulator|nr:helix-turn-helix domain-containing protein [Solirubrobacteraceae bacterium]